MIATVDSDINAANPGMPLKEFVAFTSSPSHLRLRNVPRRIGLWELTKIYVSVTYPDNATRTVEATHNGALWTATVAGCAASGTVRGGFQVIADGVDEAGNAISGYVLGVGDVRIISRDSTVNVDGVTYPLKICEEMPADPKIGWCFTINGVLSWYNGTEWIPLGGGSGDMSHAEFAELPVDDLEPDDVGLPEICTVLNQVKNLLRPAVPALLICLASFCARSSIAAEVEVNKVSNLKGGSNVVVRVDLSGLATRAELDAGWWSEWVVVPSTYNGHKVELIYIPDPGYEYWDYGYYDNGQFIAISSPIEGSGDESELHFSSDDEPHVKFIATRHRVAAPVPTKPEDIGAQPAGNYLTQHQQLTPIYSQTPTFSEWTFSPPAYIDLQYSGDLTIGWIASGSDWSDYVEVGGAQDSTSLAFTGLDGIAYTATRERTDDVIGYTLGSQTNKVLASTNGLARASDVADARAVADAAASTNATQGAALSQLSQRTNDWDAAVQNASDALAYSRATYNFQQGNTNTWFSGTNFVFGADATNKTAFAFEPGMDLMTMPCSLALMEIRDGLTQKVWDQRDWTVWYWNFKNAQQEASISARLAAAAKFNATNYAPIAWGRRTSSGLANPDQKTLWVDAEKTVLAPGMAWESTVEVSGCAYWTIVGSATLSGTTNGVITIKDFEGKPVFSIKKTSSRLAYLECGSEIYTHGSDSQGRITFTMRASVHPVGVFSTVPDDSLFVEETNAGCPVDYEWETLEQPSANSPGVYRIHFLLKPGISSDACFAKFKVEVQGETAVEFTAVQKITGGQVYNDGTHGDVKIRPVITSTAVGSVVTWEVAP